MSYKNSMTEEQRSRLSDLAKQLRSAASDVGAMSGLWDEIFDIEAFIAGQRTMLNKSAAEWIATAETILNERNER